MTEIIDLDVLVPADKKVVLAGQTYVIPGDLPMEVYLRVAAIQQAHVDGKTETELMEDMVTALVSLFCWKIPESDEVGRNRLEQSVRNLGVTTLNKVLTKVYGGEDADEADADEVDDEADPTPAKVSSRTRKTS